MGEDDACNPTAQFFIKGERRGTQCFKWTCKCCKGCRFYDLVENVGFKLLP